MADDPEYNWRRAGKAGLFTIGLGGWITGYFSSADLIGRLNLSADAQKLLAILYILVFATVILAILVARFFISDRKEKFANITPTLHSTIARAKDLWSDIDSRVTDGELNPDAAQQLLKDAQRRLREICDEVAHIFAMLTGTHCRAAIKVVILGADGQPYVVTIARDNLTFRQYPHMDEQRRRERTDPLAKNSQFLRLSRKDVPAYAFVSNDLSREADFECTSIDAYQLIRNRPLSRRTIFQRLSGDPWPLPYKSTITVSLRNSLDSNDDEEPHVVGFLAVDSESRWVFNRRWDPHICFAVADALFHPVNFLLAVMPEDQPEGPGDAAMEHH